ncbi:inositol-pentakisphosphate 2-kinase isoform 4 [Pontoporia blainvillei]|uniref:Inositol-pentakisphosphate 2-kinase isoform 4 n=1 Tax=Pontoporia blainvillei TaxID=48723 RepID=A0ABX0S7D6_PONBL|nr:inositol-pentakisphosphate 2-kinase isoform 4 [Pontoporia blainvillei]
MDEGKMDENEWGYHGEGNKSLVVAHAQDPLPPDRFPSSPPSGRLRVPPVSLPRDKFRVPPASPHPVGSVHCSSSVTFSSRVCTASFQRSPSRPHTVPPATAQLRVRTRHTFSQPVLRPGICTKGTWDKTQTAFQAVTLLYLGLVRFGLASCPVKVTKDETTALGHLPLGLFGHLLCGHHVALENLGSLKAPLYDTLTTSEEIFQHLQNIVDFGKNVMKEFLGESYVHCGIRALNRLADTENEDEVAVRTEEPGEEPSVETD